MPQQPPAFTSAPPERQSPLAGLPFSLDAVPVACEGQLSTLDLSELAGMAVQGDEGNAPQAIATLAAFLQIALGPAQYVRFRNHCREHKTDDDTLIAIMQMINGHIGVFVEAETGRPPCPQPSSSDGPAARAEPTTRGTSLQRGAGPTCAPATPA